MGGIADEIQSKIFTESRKRVADKGRRRRIGPFGKFQKGHTENGNRRYQILRKQPPFCLLLFYCPCTRRGLHYYYGSGIAFGRALDNSSSLGYNLLGN